LILKGASSQTANLLELQNSSGGIVASIDANGRPTFEDTVVALKYSGAIRSGWHYGTGGFFANEAYGYFFSPNAGINYPDAGLIRGGAAGVIQPASNESGAAGAFALLEMAAAPAGQANKVILYAEDNGSGKTRLMVKFGTGAAQQIAIEA